MGSPVTDSAVPAGRYSVDTPANRTVAQHEQQQQLTLHWHMMMHSQFRYAVVADACALSMKQLYRLRCKLGIRQRTASFGQAMVLLYVTATGVNISQRGIPYELQRMADHLDLNAARTTYVD